MKRSTILRIIPSALLLMVMLWSGTAHAQTAPVVLPNSSVYLPLVTSEGGNNPQLSGPVLVRIEDHPQGVSQQPDSFCLTPDAEVSTAGQKQVCAQGGDYTGSERPNLGVQLPFSQVALPVVEGQVVTATQMTLNLASNFSASTQLTTIGPDQYRNDLIGAVISETKAATITGLLGQFQMMGLAKINESVVLAAGQNQVVPTLKQQLDYARAMEAFAKARGGLPFSIAATDPVYNFSGILESTFGIEAAKCGISVSPQEAVIADGNYSPGFTPPVKVMAHIRFANSALQDCMVNSHPYLTKLDYYSLVDLMLNKAPAWQKWDSPIRQNLLPIVVSPVSTQPIGWVGQLPTPPEGSGWVIAVTTGLLGAKGAYTLYGYWNASTQVFEAAYGAIFMLPGASCDTIYGHGVCYHEQNLR